MDLVKILSEQYMKSELPEMNVGDTVRVSVRVKEGTPPHLPLPTAGSRPGMKERKKASYIP